MGMITKEQAEGWKSFAEALSVGGVQHLCETIINLYAEIADSAAREADLRNRAEVAEAKLASNIYPEVYRIEDGHSYKESFWPTLKERHECALCGSLEHLHIQAHHDVD